MDAGLDLRLGTAGPFVDQTAEHDYFDLDLFRQYLSDCDGLIDRLAAEPRDKPRDPALRELAATVLDIFEYTLFLLYCHADAGDLFEIENHESLEAEDCEDEKWSTWVLMAIRDTTHRLVMAL
jgi:hypothetical protein